MCPNCRGMSILNGTTEIPTQWMTKSKILQLLDWNLQECKREVDSKTHCPPPGFHFSMVGDVFFLSVTSLGVYATMASGWASNSQYALLGGVRALAQTIFYEVRLALILLFFVGLVGTFKLGDFLKYQQYVWGRTIYFQSSFIIVCNRSRPLLEFVKSG